MLGVYPLGTSPLGDIPLIIPSTAWIEDALPAGATTAAYAETWNWVSTPVNSGSLAHQSANVAGIHQHYFYGATATITPQSGDRIYTDIYINPAAPPQQIMLQFFDGNGWEHRAYWGANLITWGTDGTNSRRYMGALPQSGAWVRLEVPADDVGISGIVISGMSFALYDGQVTWDATGISSGTPSGANLSGSASESDTAYGGFSTGPLAQLSGSSSESDTSTGGLTTSTTAISFPRAIHTLSPGNIVEFFVLDATKQGGDVRYFHSGRNSLNELVVWQGNTYTPIAIEATGFEFNGRGVLPRPKIRIGNVTRFMTYLVDQYADLIGASVTRKRTMVKYLDAINFPGGNPYADPSAYFPDDVYYIRKKVTENKALIEFELGSAHDVEGTMIPGRQFIANTCTWSYRRYAGGAFDYTDAGECGYAGSAYFKKDGTATANPAEDVCGRRTSDCKLRFGANSELPYGGFIMVGRLGM